LDGTHYAKEGGEELDNGELHCGEELRVSLSGRERREKIAVRESGKSTMSLGNELEGLI
jgi:hypothetical protein